MRPKIEVTVGKIPEGRGKSLHQKLDHAIRIAIKKDENIKSIDDVHFLQFITRQLPDYYTLNQENKIAWTTDFDFTSDPSKPRWRVDVAEKFIPFYEFSGASNDEEDYAVMYDQPEFSQQNERIVACTFLIAKNKGGEFEIFKEVRWSRQYVLEENKPICSYQYQIFDTNQLPDWAIYTLKDAYGTNGDIGKESEKMFDIPDFLYQELSTTKEEALEAAGNNFLSPPNNWILNYDPKFMQLLETPTRGEKEIEKSNENKGIKSNENTRVDYRLLTKNELFKEAKKRNNIPNDIDKTDPELAEGLKEMLYDKYLSTVPLKEDIDTTISAEEFFDTMIKIARIPASFVITDVILANSMKKSMYEDFKKSIILNRNEIKDEAISAEKPSNAETAEESKILRESESSIFDSSSSLESTNKKENIEISARKSFS